MNIEKTLLSKVVNEKDYSVVAESGVTENFFYEPSNRAMFRFIRDAVSEHGQVPSQELLKRNDPSYKFLAPEKTSDAFSHLIKELRTNRSFTILEEALSDSAEAFEAENLDRMISILSAALGEVSTTESTTRDIELTGSVDQILDHFDEIQQRDPDEYLGIPMGFDTIDSATQGFQDQQLVVFVGPPKAGKSTIMALAANEVVRQNKNALVIGFEMTNEEQYMRLFAMEAHIDHSKIRGGKDKILSKKDWEALEEAGDYYRDKHENGARLWLSNDTHNNTTLDGVQAKIDKYKPDVLIVDGVYMMTDQVTGEVNTPQALTNITRGFKRLAQNNNIPIIITTQVLEWKMDKKKGIQSSSIGYSSSFAQDADAIIGVERTDDPNTNKVKIVLARNAPPTETYVRWDWEAGTFEELGYNPFGEEGGDGGEDGFASADY